MKYTHNDCIYTIIYQGFGRGWISIIKSYYKSDTKQHSLLIELIVIFTQNTNEH